MKKIFTFISVLCVTGMAYADLQFRSMSCSYRNLTLNMAIVANQDYPENTKANAKGYIIFRVDGYKAIGRGADLAIDSYPYDHNIQSFVNGRGALDLSSGTELNSYLQSNKPLIYSNAVKVAEMNRHVSYIPVSRLVNGKEVVVYRQVNWDRCDFNYDGDRTLGANDLPSEDFNSVDLMKFLKAEALKVEKTFGKLKR